MSGRRLPRGAGTVITCGGCKCTSITGQVIVGLHRAWLLETQGWALATASTRPNAPRHGDDLCPDCAPQDRLNASWHAFMARRIASRKRWGERIARESDIVQYDDGTLTPVVEARDEFYRECGFTPEAFLGKWHAGEIIQHAPTIDRARRAKLLENR